MVLKVYFSFLLWTSVTSIGFQTTISQPSSCNFVQLNRYQYRFNVWILAPYEAKYKFSYQRIKPALNKALHDGWKDISSLTNVNISSKNLTIGVQYKNTKCNADYAPTVALDIHDNSLLSQCSASDNTIFDRNAIIGVTCDYSSGRVADLANVWGWPLIYPGVRTTAFDQKNGTSCCSTMVRTGITATSLGKLTTSLFKRFQWNTSAIFYTHTNSHGAFVDQDTSNDCSTMLKGITNAFTEEKWENDKNYYEVNDWSTDANMEDAAEKLLMENFKKFARVSIWCVGRRVMRKIMLAADRLGMTNGDYAFLYIDLYNSNVSYFWTDNDDHMEYDTSKEDESSNISAIQTHSSLRALTVISLYTPTSVEYREFSEEMKKEIKAQSNNSVVEYNEFINPFITYYYDSMRLFVYGVLRALCSSSGLNNGVNFVKNLWGSEFEILGRNFTTSETGDQKLDFAIVDMNNKTNKFEVVLKYNGKSENFEKFGEIDWPGIIAPRNAPTCGFDNEHCGKVQKSSTTVYYVLGAAAAVLLLVCAAMMFLYRKMRREKRLRKKLWKVRWEDIDFSRNRKWSIAESKDSSQSVSSSNGGYPIFPNRQVFTKIGTYKGIVVAVKELRRRKLTLNRAMLVELQEIYGIENNHICKFIGAVDEAPHISILTEYCSRGSLQDLLEDEKGYEMDDVFKNSLISDITEGMVYLHKSFFLFHGNLKSSNCLIDSRFVVKLTDFGLAKFRESTRTNSITGFKYYENKLWTAPEHLRDQLMYGSQKGDVYSYGIVVQEIVYRKGVFYRKDALGSQEILLNVTSMSEDSPPFRPTLEDEEDVVVDVRLKALVSKCWAENPQDRPAFHEIQHEVKKMHRNKSLMDSLLNRLENYSKHLEDMVEIRTLQFKVEKERADTLLYQMLPRSVADQLKAGNNVLPMSYESVTIFFSDIVGFTAISHSSDPMQVVNMLNDLYTMFDRILDKFDVYKVETIGDAYMVVSGLPDKNGDNHASEIARMSLCLLNTVTNCFVIRHMPETQLKLRVGIHTGPVVAGVVGRKMPRYCLFGDTVNTAARMESNGKPLAIHISPKTKDVLDAFETFILEERTDEVFLKGLGTWKTFWLKGESGSAEEPSKRLPDARSPLLENYKNDKNHGNIVTFEVETTNDIDNCDSKTCRPADTKATTSIIKEKQSPLFGTKQRRNLSQRKRRRSGITSVSEMADLEGTLIPEFQPISKEVAVENAHDSNLNTNVHDSKSQESMRSIPMRTLKHRNVSHHSVQDSRKTGRDSGIGLGFDNVNCLDDTEETYTTSAIRF